MAIIFMEGFDSYLNGSDTAVGVVSRWVNTGTASNIQANAGRINGKCVRMGQGSSSVSEITSPPWESSVSEFTFASAVRWNYGTTNGVRASIMFMNGSGFQCGLQFNIDGSIDVYRYTSATVGTLLGTSAPNVLMKGVWQWMDVEVVISDTVGRVSIWLDNVKVYELTGVDTNNSGGVVDRVSFPSASANYGAVREFDDLYVTDSASRLGERRIEYIVPNGDDAIAFVRNTGATNWEAVDETGSNSDTDFVQGTSIGDTDTYNFSELSSTPLGVDALRFIAYATKTDAAARSLALQVIGSTGTVSDGPSYPLLTTYSHLSRLVELDPSTTLPWVPSAIPTLKGGPKVAS